jgi:hypothetical protein
LENIDTRFVIYWFAVEIGKYDFNFFWVATEIGHYCVSKMGFERVGTGIYIQMICLGD